VATLKESIEVLESVRERIPDANKVAEVDAAIQDGRPRMDAMRAALDEWNARAASHPDQWNPDGTSRVVPGWPTDPAAK
jgi:hypothetical protein